MTRLDLNFAALLVAQAGHSIEEYRGHLWAVFPPATFITGLISEDRRLGFIIFNVVLLVFGVWCLFWPVRQRWPSMGGVIALWAVIEIVNGIGHPVWTLRQGGYPPGVITAPILLVLAVYLVLQYAKMRHANSAHAKT